ncbi:S41 family peptidase [Candidatus Wolfebacteria bacterium]|nr:S41 family peptidase [Candidatus Wolfebacteria bacterium]
MLKLFKNSNIVSFITLVVILAVSGSFYYAGYKQGIEHPKITIVKGLADLEEGKEKSVDFKLFWDAWNVLKEKFVDADKLDNQNLVYGAISGMFGATNDPYSVFMPPTEAKSFTQEVSGEFGGIGAELGIRQNQLVIVSPLKNSPAERAGLQAGDKIVKIYEEFTAGMTVEKAVSKIRGEKGTNVTLTIVRDGWEETKEYTITREIIQIPTLDWKIINSQGKEDSEGKILYVRLYNFYERAPFQFYQMVLQAAFKNPDGMVLDLRNNPGGYLDAAVDIANWFFKKNSLVVSEKFRSGETTPLKTLIEGVFKDFPVVVLINQGSASASEILAGALRDNRGIKLIGEKSFGKGSVQEVADLGNSALAKITIAHWLTPSGLVIEKNGLVPDYPIEITDKDKKENIDSQLNKALEVLTRQLAD